MDFENRMLIDMLGYPSNSDNSDGIGLHFWKNSDSKDANIDFFSKPTLSSVSFCKLPPIHSNAFVDLNGDCKPDLFLTCEDGTFEIWISLEGYSTWEKNFHLFYQRASCLFLSQI